MSVARPWWITNSEFIRPEAPGGGNSGKGGGKGGGRGGGWSGQGRGQGSGGGKGGGSAPTIAVKSFAVDFTSTGTQDLTTTDLGGLTPKAAIVFYGDPTAVDTIAANAVLSVGMTDGTTQCCSTITSVDNTAATATRVYGDASHILAQRNTGSTTLFVSAAFSAWVTNGITINVDTAAAATRIVTVVFFAGSNLSADVQKKTLTTSGSSVTVTAGFEPNAVFMLNNLYLTNSTLDASYSNGAQLGLAFATYDGSTALQCSQWFYERNGQPSGDPHISLRTGSLYQGSLGGSLTASTFTSTGFDIDVAGGQNFSSAEVGILSLNIPSQNVWCGVKDSPTSTGDWALTDLGSTPVAAFMLTNRTIATGSASDDTAGHFGFYGTDGTTEVHPSVMIEDAAGTTNTATLVATALDVNTDDQLASHDATFSSFDATGATWSFTVADGTARKWPVMLFGN